jgi:hypothetical protein
MFKIWLFISKFTLIKDLVFWLNQLHVNHKSHVSHYHYVSHHLFLKTLTLLCTCYLKIHDSHSNAFVFYLFIQQL